MDVERDRHWGVDLKLLAIRQQQNLRVQRKEEVMEVLIQPGANLLICPTAVDTGNGG